MKKFSVLISCFLCIFMFLCYIDIKANDGKDERYYIGEDYIVIDYVEYEMRNNVITYNDFEYKLINNNLYRIENDKVIEMIPLPVEENRIKDQDVIKKLNMDLVMISRSSLDNPNAENLPYNGSSNGDIFAESPYLYIIEDGHYHYLYALSINGRVGEEYTVIGLYGDGYGNWHTANIAIDQGFSSHFTFRPLSAMRYLKLFISACKYDNPFTYSLIEI